MNNNNNDRTAFRHLVVEAFFALLPLIVLGAVWSHRSIDHYDSFWSAPEISMTSCVLYGLTLTRTLQGAVSSAARARQGSTGGARLAAAGYELLLLIPLIGVIYSAILIYMSVEQVIPKRSVANLVASVLCYGVLGGHGLRSAERNDEEE
jgi:hypothetical protein